MNIEDILFQLESELQRSFIRRSADLVDSLLRDDFQEFGSSGRAYSKAEIIAALQAETDKQIRMSAFRVKLLSETIALVTYRATIGEDESSATASLRSSVWVWESGNWKMLFHQGTDVR